MFNDAVICLGLCTLSVFHSVFCILAKRFSSCFFWSDEILLHIFLVSYINYDEVVDFILLFFKRSLWTKIDRFVQRSTDNCCVNIFFHLRCGSVQLLHWAYGCFSDYYPLNNSSKAGLNVCNTVKAFISGI